MDTCFECGGKLKLIAKAGRLAWYENELFEVPAEFKISVCIECGEPHKDEFVKAKMEVICEAQKKTKPSQRLLMLRWVDNYLMCLLKRPGMYALDCDSLFALVQILLETRSVVINKGECAETKEIHKV